MCLLYPEVPALKKEWILRCELEGLSVRFSSRRGFMGTSRSTRDDLVEYWSSATRAGAEDDVATSRGNGDDIRGSMSPSRCWCAVWMCGARRSRSRPGSTTSALVVSICGCCSAWRSERSCSRSSASRRTPSRGKLPRVWRCGVWNSSLMGRMAGGWPLGITGFSDKEVRMTVRK
jgi:hypothetical protein